MKVLFFDPRRYKSFRPSTAPLGLLSISTYLNSKNHCAVICDRSHSKKSVEEIINENKPDIVGISVITYSAIEDACHIAECAKKSGLTVVLGGTVAASLSEYFLKDHNIDYISLGEGECTWLDIMNTLPQKEDFDLIKGLAFIKNGEYYETPEREYIDLKELPKLDWSLINPEDFLQEGFGGKKQANIYYSKGCVANCHFCYNKKFHNCKRRERNLDDVISEMEYLVDTYNVDSFNFTDDLMFINEAQAISIAQKMIERDINNKCTWIGEIRVDSLKNQKVYELLYKAGCRNLIFGIETGSQDMQKILNKRISTEEIIRTVEMCEKASITPLMTFMLGLPEESEKDIIKTVELVKKLDKAICCCQIYTPTPGSKIYEELVSQGKIKREKNVNIFSNIIFGEKIAYNISNVSKKDIYTVYRYFKLKEFKYKDKNSTDKQMFKVITNVLKSMSGKGIVFFFVSGINNAINLIQLLSFFFHPIIRKKYGLFF